MASFTVLPIKGVKSQRALNVFVTLLMGLKHLPAYMGMSFEEFLKLVYEMSEKEQEAVLRSGVMFVNLESDEIQGALSFCADANGVPYSSENLKSVELPQLVDMILAVAMKIAAFKIHMITNEEKKN